jgi:hypothetical protein
VSSWGSRGLGSLLENDLEDIVDVNEVNCVFLFFSSFIL